MLGQTRPIFKKNGKMFDKRSKYGKRKHDLTLYSSHRGEAVKKHLNLRSGRKNI